MGKQDTTERGGEKVSLLKQERERRGWSREFVADSTESEPRTVGRWERGDTFPSPYHLQKLCELFGKLPHELGLQQRAAAGEGEEAAQPPLLSQASPHVGGGPITDPGRLNWFPPQKALPHRLSALGRRHPLLRFAALSCLLLLIGGAALLVASSVARPSAADPRAESFGSISFISSEQFTGSTSAGINDEVQISLHGISPPPQGKSYFAWLLPDRNRTEAPDVTLGSLSLDNGSEQVLYRGDAQHTNLLAVTSRFLITEEDTTPPPIYPSLDTSTWKYYAEIPQTPSPRDGLSLLDHVRHLLAADPTLSAFHLPGGLAGWLSRDTQDVSRLAAQAKANWRAGNTAALRADLVGILDYLDGTNHISGDVPAGTPLEIDPRVAQIGMLNFTNTQYPPGYCYHIALHLNGVIQSPGATPAQHQLAAQITSALNQITAWLQQLHLDTLHLVQSSDGQLLAPTALAPLQEIVQLAQFAYSGPVNPATGASAGGAVWMTVMIQHLATLDVRVFSGS